MVTRVFVYRDGQIDLPENFFTYLNPCDTKQEHGPYERVCLYAYDK